jgi:hypothetical protein
MLIIIDVINQFLKDAVTIWANGFSSGGVVNVFPSVFPIGEEIVYHD